jgi:hypothetical protein
VNEGRTTIIFAAVAAVSFGLAWWSRPATISSERDLEGEIIGNPVFASFEDPGSASSFQIVKFNEELGRLSRFEIARDRDTNMWRLPSYDDYPADAAEQVRDATTPLIGLTVLDIASFDRGDHSLYGVINPDDEALSAAETGVGMLVRVKDDKDQIVASLIIGKEVGQAEGQRYVRNPIEDAVYIVELDTTPFSTDFTKWIKGELLGVRGFDITDIGLRNYAVLPTQRGLQLRRNFDADVSFDPTTSKWNLDKLLTYEGATATETALAEGEQLQSQALNDLRTAVQDLKIVGVRRKPSGLSADLKAEKALLDNEESLRSLQEQGFFPGETDNGIEIYATGGETLIGTKDGVQYLLRFGESITAVSGDEEQGGEEETGLNRYLLVTASIDDSKFPPPELQPVPETVEEMLQAERAAASPAAPAQEPPAQEPPAEERVTEEPVGDEAGSAEAAPPASAEPAPASAEEQSATAEDPTDAPAAEVPSESAEESTGTEPSSDPPVTEESPEDPAASDDEEDELNQCGPQEEDSEQETAQDPEPAQEQVSEPSPPTTEAASAQEAAAAPVAEQGAAQETAPQDPATPPPADDKVETAEELQERLEFVQATIAKENQRKLDERNEKIDQARKKAQELNARFANWYYIVSDSGYRKLTLSREQLIGAATSQTPAPPAFGNPGGGLPPGFPGFPPQP